ncbi:MAG: hypothetical protein GC190_11410 [Alphaproteobacteria bacterium]|nr:hypothetical protein [Alphaproteobacteria bacterium]
MSYRKILVPLFDGAGDEVAARQAVAIAAALGGHVTALLARPDPAETVRLIDPSLSPRVIRELVDSARSATSHELARARAMLETVAKQSGITENEGAPGWSLDVREGLADDVMGQEALLSDLTIFAHPAQQGDRPIWGALEAALLGSRRPLIAVPKDVTEILGKKVVIGWDGGRAVSHALFTALPLLSRASAVEILTVASGPAERPVVEKLKDYLSLHGIRATQRSVNPGTMDIGFTLADAAKRAGAGLLVVGGYGHSRIREFVLGGVTRHLLANASLPVFMAH